MVKVFKNSFCLCNLTSISKIRMLRMTQSFRRYKYFIAFFGFFLFLLFSYSSRPCSTNNETKVEVVSSEKQRVNKQEPLIFIGGMPRSGTTLARVMLDAHPDIRCGEETRVVPRILQMRKKWKASPKEHMRLQEAGVTDEVIDDAVASFVLHIIVNHGSDAKRMCNKDPFTMKSAAYLSELFPNSKFLFMIRDGRATVHSIISRKITITGFDLSSYRQCLEKWNAAMTAMKAECDNLGPNKCLPVYYEKLVLNPKEWMGKILTFLEIEWSDLVLKHETLINQPNGISLSKVERSSDQVIAPVNLNALSKWVGNIPKDVLEEMDEIAPMLRTLGYDPHANPPKYGEADSMVLDNTLKLSKNAKQYEEIANRVRSSSKDKTEKD